MTGPPTPPPSSALEIADAVRSSVPPQVQSGGVATTSQAPASSSQPLTSYQVLFQRLAELAMVEKPNYRQLAQTAELGDLNAEGDNHPTRLLLTTPLVLSYLILGDASSARFALQRLPDSLKANPVPQALFSLVAAVSERKYDKLYARAEELQQIPQQVQFSEIDFNPVVLKLVAAFVDSFRRKTFSLLSRAYTSIPMSLAQAYLGFTPEQVLTVAQDHRWSYNAASQVLAPAPPGKSKPNATPTGTSNLETFSTVARGLVIDVD